MKKSGEIQQLPVINVNKNEKIGNVKGFIINPEKKEVVALTIVPAEPLEGLWAVPFSCNLNIVGTAVMVEDLDEPVSVSEDDSLLSACIKEIYLIGSAAST
ncbi:MAG: PRC-barrel domain-containing protein, partial [bacterium]